MCEIVGAIPLWLPCPSGDRSAETRTSRYPNKGRHRGLPLPSTRIKQRRISYEINEECFVRTPRNNDPLPRFPNPPAFFCFGRGNLRLRPHVADTETALVHRHAFRDCHRPRRQCLCRGLFQSQHLQIQPGGR